MQMMINGCDKVTKLRMFRLLYELYVLCRHGRRLRAATLVSSCNRDSKYYDGYVA